MVLIAVAVRKGGDGYGGDMLKSLAQKIPGSHLTWYRINNVTQLLVVFFGVVSILLFAVSHEYIYILYTVFFIVLLLQTKRNAKQLKKKLPIITDKKR